MNVDIGAEAALFPEKEYINGIAVAVQRDGSGLMVLLEKLSLKEEARRFLNKSARPLLI